MRLIATAIALTLINGAVMAQNAPNLGFGLMDPVPMAQSPADAPVRNVKPRVEKPKGLRLTLKEHLANERKFYEREKAMFKRAGVSLEEFLAEAEESFRQGSRR